MAQEQQPEPVIKYGEMSSFERKSNGPQPFDMYIQVQLCAEHIKEYKTIISPVISIKNSV